MNHPLPPIKYNLYSKSGLIFNKDTSTVHSFHPEWSPSRLSQSSKGRERGLICYAKSKIQRESAQGHSIRRSRLLKQYTYIPTIDGLDSVLLHHRHPSPPPGIALRWSHSDFNTSRAHVNPPLSCLPSSLAHIHQHT